MENGRWSGLKLFLPFVLSFFLSAQSLERLAGGVLMVGFDGAEAPPESSICREIRRYGLAGVILFDRHPSKKGAVKNIAGPAQLRKLTRQLRACSPDGKLLIAVDQEGGVVQRLKKSRGFAGDYPRPSVVAQRGESYARKIYDRMGKELADLGINYNLAPVVDLALNPKNRVIVGWGRSYGKDPETVARYASIFIDAMHRHGVLGSLKHFPGHGSSTGDTHKSFVDVTRQWRSVELEPYRRLIARGDADSVMVAHVFNRRLDPRYPASLSRKTVEGILRKKLGFDGVAITDDLQMGAIARRYSLPETLRLALNAGNDLLLFGNQLDPRHRVSASELVETLSRLVREGRIDRARLREAAGRVRRLKEKAATP
jgi:beta-N-acetylhexosaminidase